MNTELRWWDDDVLDRERWRDLVEPVLERIVGARQRGRFPQALLLVGPAGLGRELVAVETAVLLTCHDAAAPWLASTCADRVRTGVHPDVVAVLPEPPSNQIKIDQVRVVVDSAAGRPYEGRRRVWVFDGTEVGRFGAEAANAFLKTLEEPPDHVQFLLLAANPAAVLPTIRSRCQQLALPGPVAVARYLGAEVPPELTATALGGGAVGEAIGHIEGALQAAMRGEVAAIARLPTLISEGNSTFEVVAAAAMVMAGDENDADRAGELVRLAADLLATDRRVRALNLNRDRQLTSCLLRWYREQFTA
jgi:DNA polymerase-3 subunit delta'